MMTTFHVEQVLATIQGFKLTQFLEGQDIPLKFNTLEDVVNVLNQEYLNCK